MPWLPVLIIAGTGLAWPVAATEKHWIAHQAEAIIVGTLTKSVTFPWLDGWHINGVIQVDETLYGNEIPRQISFRFVCRWNALRRWWLPPALPRTYKERGLWFLWRADERTWNPSDGMGYQRLSDRAYWEDYIRRYKR